MAVMLLEMGQAFHRKQDKERSEVTRDGHEARKGGTRRAEVVMGGGVDGGPGLGQMSLEVRRRWLRSVLDLCGWEEGDRDGEEKKNR